MKTTNFRFLKFACVVALLAIVASCNDNDDEIYYYTTLGDLQKTESDSYIASDLGKKLLIANPEVAGADAKTGDRVYAAFTLDGQKPDGYDEKINIFYYYSVLVKDPVHLSASNQDEIADDNISASDIWTSKNYLNFRFQFLASGEKTHVVNLATVDNPQKAEDGYQYVEFRHNAVLDSERSPYTGIVSFNIDRFKAENPQLKGFIVRVKTYSHGEEFYKIDLADNNGNTQQSAPAKEANGLNILQ